MFAKHKVSQSMIDAVMGVLNQNVPKTNEKQQLSEASPFDWKNTPSQLPKKKGALTGHDSKEVSTGTVYTKKAKKEAEPDDADDKVKKEEVAIEEEYGPDPVITANYKKIRDLHQKMLKDGFTYAGSKERTKEDGEGSWEHISHMYHKNGEQHTVSYHDYEKRNPKFKPKITVTKAPTSPKLHDDLK